MNPNYGMLPEHMREAMQLWLEQGIEPGDFLLAVLCNDLREAVGRADHINIHRLPDYVRFLYNEVPGMCYGSPEKVRKWADHNGLAGRDRAA